MKFKCLLNEYQKMGELLSIVKTLEKHDDRVIIITRPDSVTLTVPRESNKPYIWFDINIHSFFSVYKMEGVNPSDTETDVIYFEVNASYLATALGSIKKAVNSVEIKLGKQEFPFFTVNMRLQSNAANQDNSVDVHHQVPVIIIPRLGWSDYEIPYNTLDFEAQAKCPRFSILKRFLDTFKHLPKIRFVLRQDDTMTIEAEGDSTRHFTIFCTKVGNYPDYDVGYKGRPISSFVEHKKVTQFIHSLAFQGEVKLSCMIEHNKNFKMFFRIRDDILAHFIVAAVFDDDDNKSEVSATDSE